MNNIYTVLPSDAFIRMQASVDAYPTDATVEVEA